MASGKEADVRLVERLRVNAVHGQFLICRVRLESKLAARGIQLVGRVVMAPIDFVHAKRTQTKEKAVDGDNQSHFFENDRAYEHILK